MAGEVRELIGVRVYWGIPLVHEILHSTHVIEMAMGEDDCFRFRALSKVAF